MVGDSADFSRNGDINGGKWRDQGFGAAGYGDGGTSERRVTVRVTVMTGHPAAGYGAGDGGDVSILAAGLVRLVKAEGERRRGDAAFAAAVWGSPAWFDMGISGGDGSGDGGAGGDHFRGPKE